MAADPTARERFIRAGIDLIRRQGYAATSVGEICTAAGLSKGAFFHHFASKDDLALACLDTWNAQMAAMDDNAPYQQIANPVERAVAFMATMIELFSNPAQLPSCLAGTTVQELYRTHPEITSRAHACFETPRLRFKAHLDAARIHAGLDLDTDALATLWLSTLQGALVVAKAAGDARSIRTSLTHVKTYIEGLLRPS